MRRRISPAPSAAARSQSFFPVEPLVWWQALLFAGACEVVVVLMRIGLNTAGASEAPYAPFIAGVLVTAVWGGRLSGTATAVVGALISPFLINSPKPGLAVHLRGVMIYALLAGLVIAVVEVMKGALRREAAANERLSVLSQELHHRVKNVITLAASIVQQTGRNVASTSEYQSKVTDRLLALGRAQDLLITTAGEGVPLSHLLDQILAPFDVAGHLVHPIRGPAVTVPHALAVSLSLLLNELATNATKYGALSVAEGRLEVSWRRQSSWTWLEWTETQGPTVAAPTTSGFGSRLFLSALPQDLGLCEIVFDPAGVRCRIGLKSEDLSKDVV